MGDICEGVGLATAVAPQLVKQIESIFYIKFCSYISVMNYIIRKQDKIDILH